MAVILIKKDKNLKDDIITTLGIISLPTLSIGSRETLYFSNDRLIRVELVSTGKRRGYFSHRQSDGNGKTICRTSPEFFY